MVSISLMSATYRKALLTLHIVAAAGALGGDLAFLALAAWGHKATTDPVSVYPAAHTLAEVLIAPLALLTLLTGVMLATLSDYGLLRYWWTAIKLAITVTLSVLVFVAVIPALGQAANDATGTAHAVASSKRTLLLIIPSFASSLVIVNVLLAVTKPAKRLLNRAGGPPAGAGTVPAARR